MTTYRAAIAGKNVTLNSAISSFTDQSVTEEKGYQILLLGSNFVQKLWAPKKRLIIFKISNPGLKFSNLVANH